MEVLSFITAESSLSAPAHRHRSAQRLMLAWAEPSERCLAGLLPSEVLKVLVVDSARLHLSGQRLVRRPERAMDPGDGARVSEPMACR